MRAAHTLFECVVPSESMIRETGKVLANWSATVDGKLVGGERPSIKDIRGEENLMLEKHLDIPSRKVLIQIMTRVWEDLSRSLPHKNK